MLDNENLRSLSKNLIADPDDYMNSFRTNLDMYISQKEITLSEVAEAADLPLSTVKNFLYGNSKDVHLYTAVKLAKVFGVSVDELIGCGTLSPQTCESLQLIRMLPESFTHFVRWATHFHYDMLTNNKVSNRAIEVMIPEISPGSGNVKMTNNFEIMDISSLDDELRPKVFMGIKVLDNAYAPRFFENDILLLANDREPRFNELVVLNFHNNMWIARPKTERRQDNSRYTCYYSIRHGHRMCSEDDDLLVMGYIASVHHI